MTKVISKTQIKKYVRDNIGQLRKDELLKILIDNGIKIKQSTSKEVVIRAIFDNKIELLEIYNSYKDRAFGLYPIDLENLLDIDKKLRLKMVKQDLLEVAYTKDEKAYGTYLTIPFYSLESLNKLDSKVFEEWKMKNNKKASSKQLMALEKAREKSKENRMKREQEENEKKQFFRSKFFREILNNKDDYVILDVETTGLDSDDKIIEISIIDMNGDTLLNTYVNTDKEINYSAYEVHGITKEDIKDSPKFQDIIKDIDKAILNKKVLAYNSEFDVRMLRQNGYKNIINDFCLMHEYMWYVDSERWISLSNAMIYEDINIMQDHRSLGDCKCCLELINKIGS